MFVVPLTASDDPTGTPGSCVYFGVQLLDALSSFAPGRGMANEPDEPQVYPYNLKLVMDVELNVSVLFGQRQLPLEMCWPFQVALYRVRPNG